MKQKLLKVKFLKYIISWFYNIFKKTTLIIGITGEQSIFKRRVEQTPLPGTPLNRPKRLRLLTDVSGSMYR